MFDILGFDIETVESTEKRGIFKIGPLPRGYGHTLANPLRRVLLSSLEGAGITSLRISGADHEYSTIKGIQETVIDIMINLKGVRFKVDSDEPQVVKLSVKGAKEVTAKDIDVTESVTIMNPELKIATMTDKTAKLDLEMTVEKGFGYKAGNENVRSEVGRLPMDASFSPVERVTFSIDETRKGEKTNLDMITMTIVTDGSVTPNYALSHSSKVLLDVFGRFVDILAVESSTRTVTPVIRETAETVAAGDVAGQSIESIDISKRAKTALVAAGINTVADLVAKTEAELKSLSGFGDKALEDVKNFLNTNSLTLKA